MLREGVAASYVGPETNGHLRGDRAWVFSDEGTEMHIRWTSGRHTGHFDRMRPLDLAIDDGLVEDEFGFETVGHIGVTVNVAALHDRGGELAVFEALQAEGHLGGLETAARNAVAGIRAWMEHDATWTHVAGALEPEDFETVVRSAVVAAVIAATEGDDPTDDEG